VADEILLAPLVSRDATIGTLSRPIFSIGKRADRHLVGQISGDPKMTSASASSLGHQ